MKFLKTLPLTILAAVVIFCASATQNVAEAGMQDFAIVNRSGHAIYHLYVSRSDAYSWEEDLLDAYDTIDPGETTVISFSWAEDGIFWDMRAIFDDGTDIIWEDIDLTTVYRITIDRYGNAHYN